MKPTETKPTIDASAVIAQLGHSFDIILESMVGSTGYGWCLKGIPAGVELISTENVPIRKGVAPVRQIFTFAAIEPIKGGLIEFDLLCLYNLSCEIADHSAYQVYIYREDENDELARKIGSSRFIKGTGTMVHAKPIPPYGFADCEKAILLYGFPPDNSKCPGIIDSKANCLLKYGNPFGVSTDESECQLKYGYPITTKYGYPPPIYKYGFPLTNKCGENYVIKEDKDNCIVKYGIPPGNVSTNNEDCIVKYGFPEKK
ncbi:MAG: hypothetical protein WCX48_10820 [Bacteroidales bacterium]|jgi:hypothetical protein